MRTYKPYQHRFSHPAQYDVDIINNTIVIYDLDQDGASVTTDIRNVLADIHQNHTDLTHKNIIYRDSDKVFDGVAVNKKGKFDHFYAIRETDLNKALAKVNAITV